MFFVVVCVVSTRKSCVVIVALFFLPSSSSFFFVLPATIDRKIYDFSVMTSVLGDKMQFIIVNVIFCH